MPRWSICAWQQALVPKRRLQTVHKAVCRMRRYHVTTSGDSHSFTCSPHPVLLTSTLWHHMLLPQLLLLLLVLLTCWATAA